MFKQAGEDGLDRVIPKRIIVDDNSERRTRRSSSQGPGSGLKCNLCGHQGHLARACRSKRVGTSPVLNNSQPQSVDIPKAEAARIVNPCIKDRIFKFKTLKKIPIPEEMKKGVNFEIDSPVEVLLSRKIYDGFLKWTGLIDGDFCVGVELKEEVRCATDGTFSGITLFQCEPGYGILVPLGVVQQDSRITDTLPVHKESKKTMWDYVDGFIESPISDKYPHLNGLERSSAIQVVFESEYKYGTLMWSGFDAGSEHNESYIGVELESYTKNGTDGTFGNHRLFECDIGYGIVVDANCVSKDERFSCDITSVVPKLKDTAVKKRSDNIEDNSYDCAVCFEKRIDRFAIAPCGHCETCLVCLQSLFQNKKACPICRRPIVNYLKIFI